MNKKIVSAMTTALVVGVASTTFAAASPFSDLDPDHWAYQSVMQLYNTYTADGKRVIDGMGDGTFQGKRPITRYEVAQMVAKALARTDISGTDKAALDRLAAEFSEELQSLGVRVAELEKYADKVQWHGEMRYTYQSNRFDKAYGQKQHRNNVNENLLRLEPVMEVNNHWKLKARIDASDEMSTNTSGDLKMQRGWAEGQYGSLNLKVGLFDDLTNYDRNMMFFNEMSGAEVNFGKVLRTQIRVGRLNTSDNLRYDDSVNHLINYNGGLNTGSKYKSNDPLNVQSIALTYKPGKVLSLTGAYYHFQSDIFRNSAYTDNMSEDDANIWEVAPTFRFGKFGVVGAYLRNTKADYYKHSHVVELNYGQAKRDRPGTWMAYASYRYQGMNVSMDGANDGAMYNTKGWEFGTQITIMKNIQLKGIYFKGEQLHNGQDAEKLFGRCEWFF
ncbi:MAG: S-layer homology domain-containing protein [Selenomonadaceae bacterium]|nr:S-layer homology domain-containing protein [Selenomonadaceae bacterium]MBR1859390.1 S-layer homology domain-containing protein [Selenomonadaceae bacterium]